MRESKMLTARNMPHALRTQSQTPEEYYVSGSVRLPGDLAFEINEDKERTRTSHRSIDDSNPMHEDWFTLEAFRAGGTYICTIPAHHVPNRPSHWDFVKSEQFGLTGGYQKKFFPTPVCPISGR